jgi:glucosamine--fructose-6-phosphate aminotransferase (isomerizing)
VVAEGVVAVLVASADGPLAEPMVELAADLRGRGARLLGIGGGTAFAEACDVHLAGPDLPETLAPLGAIVPAQRMIERLARDRGLDPDNPRGLRKVTQTDS